MERRCAGAVHNSELREALGGPLHDEATHAARARLDRVNAELEATEVLAQPLRRLLRSRWADERSRACDEMARLGIGEDDLCTAWHHLSPERRAFLRDVLPRIDLSGTTR